MRVPIDWYVELSFGLDLGTHITFRRNCEYHTLTHKHTAKRQFIDCSGCFIPDFFVRVDSDQPIVIGRHFFAFSTLTLCNIYITVPI